jgi:predicted phage tail protein
VGLDGVMATPGQLIRIADPGRAGKRQGGRISSATATSVIVDRAPDVVSVGDSLTVILPSGVSETHAITAISGTTLSVASPGFTETPVPDAVWTSEASNLVAQSFRVTNVKENKTDSSLTYDITAVQHVASKYALIDSGTILPVPPISQLPGLQQAPVASVSIASRVVIVQGTAEPAITISWPKADGAMTIRSNGVVMTDNGSLLEPFPPPQSM